MRKFVVLALKANPNILECLFTPLVEHASPVAERLLAMRGSFLSKHVYGSEAATGLGMATVFGIACPLAALVLANGCKTMRAAMAEAEQN